MTLRSPLNFRKGVYLTTEEEKETMRLDAEQRQMFDAAFERSGGISRKQGRMNSDQVNAFASQLRE